MAQTTASGGPSDPPGNGSGVPDSPEQWGAGGLVGDGRYRLTHRLGRGGMAEVFAAEDVRLGRSVAVKLLRADLAEDPVSKARFTREAQSVAGLNHHAVVAVYDSGEDRVGKGTVPYIVMELVEGRTIRELLVDAEAPPVDQALIIVSGVLEALAYSHQHGIVHRDIKPANVIITNSGAVKVMDFGIARALHGAASTMTQTGMVMGTPQYLSPEQALGKTVDYRSDLYSVGCMLYELLTLRPPFTGESPLAVVYQHVQDEPRIPSEVSERVPPELDGLVLRSLAKNPDDRFQSAEEMRGLVQYSLRMLQERGGHTGIWDTGYVAHGAAATPAMGTAALPHPHPHPDPVTEPALPLQAAPPGGDDTGPTLHQGTVHGGGRRWLPVLLLLIAAALAVGGGIFVAMDGGQPEKEQDTSPPPTATRSAEEGTTAPSEGEPTGERTPDGTVSVPGTWNPTTAPTGSTSPAPTAPTGSTSPAPTAPTGTTVPTDPTDPPTGDETGGSPSASPSDGLPGGPTGGIGGP